MDILAGLAAATSAIDIAKAMRAAEKNFDAAVYRGQAADLMVALSEAKVALMEAREALAAQEAEIERIRSDRQNIAALQFGRGGYRYAVGGDGGMMGYPACPSCLEKEVRAVFLVRNGGISEASCPRCHSKFTGVAAFGRSPSGGIETEAEALNRKRNEAMEQAIASVPRTQYY